MYGENFIYTKYPTWHNLLLGRLAKPIYVISLGQAIVNRQELHSCDKWDKVFKNRPSKICGRQPLKNFKEYGLLEADFFKFFKGCLPQILLGPFLNILPQIGFSVYMEK